MEEVRHRRYYPTYSTYLTVLTPLTFFSLDYLPLALEGIVQIVGTGIENRLK
jgi:hypothetical protein